MVAEVLSTAALFTCAGFVVVGLSSFPRSPLRVPLLAATLCALLWCLGAEVTAFAHGPRVDAAGIFLAYAGGILLPFSWWTLVLRWAGERGAPPPALLRRSLPWLWGWAALQCAVMATNPWHGLFLTPIDGARNAYGPLWWVMALPNHALGLATIVLATRVARLRPGVVRRQGVLIASATATVVIAHASYALWPGEPPFDVPLVALTLSTGTILVALRADAEQRERERVRAEAGARGEQLAHANRMLRMLQDRLLRAEQLRVREAVFGTLSARANDPLTALLGTIQMAIEARPQKDAVLDRLLQLAARTRDALLSADGRPPDVADPGALLRDVAEAAGARARARRVSLELKLSGTLPPLACDRALLAEGFEAVIDNAIEATPEGGTVWLEAQDLPGVGAIQLQVSDAGTGVPEALRERVFEPFFSTHDASGLGLAIARGVVQGHRGRIALLDRPGGGAVVRIELPAGAGAKPEGEARAPR